MKKILISLLALISVSISSTSVFSINVYQDDPSFDEVIDSISCETIESALNNAIKQSQGNYFISNDLKMIRFKLRLYMEETYMPQGDSKRNILEDIARHLGKNNVTLHGTDGKSYTIVFGEREVVYNSDSE